MCLNMSQRNIPRVTHKALTARDFGRLEMLHHMATVHGVVETITMDVIAAVIGIIRL